MRGCPPLWKSGRRSGRISSRDMAASEVEFELKNIAFVGMDENRVGPRWIAACEEENLKRDKA